MPGLLAVVVKTVRLTWAQLACRVLANKETEKLVLLRSMPTSHSGQSTLACTARAPRKMARLSSVQAQVSAFTGIFVQHERAKLVEEIGLP